jgi:prolipoprotein diacylglyceryltransferase
MPPPPFGNTISLGPLEFHLYGLLIGLGIVAASQLAIANWKFLGIDTQRATRALIPAIILGLIGGRVYHVASQP